MNQLLSPVNEKSTRDQSWSGIPVWSSDSEPFLLVGHTLIFSPSLASICVWNFTSCFYRAPRVTEHWALGTSSHGRGFPASCIFQQCTPHYIHVGEIKWSRQQCLHAAVWKLKKWLRIFVKDSRPLKALDNALSSDVKLLTTLRNFSFFKKNPMVEKDNNAYMQLCQKLLKTFSLPPLQNSLQFCLRTTEKLFETLVENSMKQRVKLRKVTLVSNEQLVDGHWPLSSVHPLERGSMDTWTLGQCPSTTLSSTGDVPQPSAGVSATKLRCHFNNTGSNPRCCSCKTIKQDNKPIFCWHSQNIQLHFCLQCSIHLHTIV